MISINLVGGLGNMMFQIAALESLAHLHKTEVRYSGLEKHFSYLNAEKKHNPSLQHAKDYLHIFSNFKWASGRVNGGLKKVPFHYVPISFEDNKCYQGFFQSEKYFPNRSFILNLFSPSPHITERLKIYDSVLEGKTCSLHIRRGDYVKFSKWHSLQSVSYYEKAMDEIRADKYIVFSDDIQWCKKNLKGDKFIFIEDKDYVEMFVMSRCTHNITCNSSFSWWGAWLNKNNEKKVIGPSAWFGPNKNLVTKDIIPKSWKVI